MSKTFIFTYKNIIHVEIKAEDEPQAWMNLNEKIEQSWANGVSIPSDTRAYEITSMF